MLSLRLIRNSLAITAIFSAALALGGGASVASAAAPGFPGTLPTEGPGVYLYPGGAVTTPVQLTGTISSAPAAIQTQDGTILIGSGPLPPGDGLRGQDYAGWVWTLTPTKAQLTWANLNNAGTVIQNVAGYFLGVGNVIRFPGGGLSTACLSYQDAGGGTAKWLQLNSSYDWVHTTAGCP